MPEYNDTSVVGWFHCFRSNGNLYGVFGVLNASVSISGSFGSVSRHLSYTVVRVGGETVDASITIQHTYNQASHD